MAARGGHPLDGAALLSLTSTMWHVALVRYVRWSLAVSLLVSVGHAQTPPEKRGKGSAPATPGAIVDGDLGKLLDSVMTAKEWYPNGFSGVVLVAKGGKPLLEKGYGIKSTATNEPMPADALFDWCSVTKQFTCAALLRLEMQKKLSIDDPLVKHFPKVPQDKAKVTLRQLMNHTSGIKSGDGFQGVDVRNRDEFVNAILKLPVVSQPGTKWEYSNVAYVLLGTVIEKVSGSKYERFLHEQVLKPAGMQDAWFIGEKELARARAARGPGHGQSVRVRDAADLGVSRDGWRRRQRARHAALGSRAARRQGAGWRSEEKALRARSERLRARVGGQEEGQEHVGHPHRPPPAARARSSRCSRG